VWELRRALRIVRLKNILTKCVTLRTMAVTDYLLCGEPRSRNHFVAMIIKSAPNVSSL
jgi:hypothetical protein